MSHFSVLVVGDDVEKQLAPFDENLEVERYVDYERCNIGTERREAIKKWLLKLGNADYRQDVVKDRLEHYALMTDDEYWEELKSEYSAEMIGRGKLYSTYNKKSKWDYWKVGGRWDRILILKDGSRVNSARAGDVDWDGMIEESKKELGDVWDRFQTPAGKQEGLGIMYGIRDGETKEDFIKRSERLMIFAVVKEGEWLERCKMGWWDITYDETMTEEEWAKQLIGLVKGLPGDVNVTVVDCHI